MNKNLIMHYAVAFAASYVLIAFYLQSANGDKFLMNKIGLGR